MAVALIDDVESPVCACDVVADADGSFVGVRETVLEAADVLVEDGDSDAVAVVGGVAVRVTVDVTVIDCRYRSGRTVSWL